jgi:hypothetical protein
MATRLMEVTHRSLTNIAGRVREDVAIVLPLPALLGAEGFPWEQLSSPPQLPQPHPAETCEEQPHVEKLVWLEDEGLVPITTHPAPSSSSYSAPPAVQWLWPPQRQESPAGTSQISEGEHEEEQVDLLQEVADTWGRWEQELLAPNVIACGSTGQEYVSHYEQTTSTTSGGKGSSSGGTHSSSSARKNSGTRKLE